MVISSATLEVDRLVTFFDTSTVHGKAAAAAADGAVSKSPAVVSIQGRVYPVQVSICT